MLTAETHLDAMTRIGRALADETRCRILVELAAAPAYPSELADKLGESRSKISNHLSCLRGCGLVVASWEGRKVRYEIADPRLTHALGDLLGVVLAVEPHPESDILHPDHGGSDSPRPASGGPRSGVRDPATETPPPATRLARSGVSSVPLPPAVGHPAAVDAHRPEHVTPHRPGPTLPVAAEPAGLHPEDQDAR